MAPKSFDKKKAVTFSLVHRSHEDPLFHDAEASANVLVPLNKEASKEQKREQRDQRRLKKQAMAEAALEERKEYEAGRVKKDTSELVNHFDNAKIEEELRAEGRRDNEGEAALYGIYFDDSKYDYMKHLKSIGETRDAVFISKKDQEKKKGGKKGAGLMLNAEYAQKNNIQMLKDVMPSDAMVPRNYDSEKNVPDTLAGFNPDMDPALLEVLEALEDEEYVTDQEDDGNEDLFNQLLASGEADSEEEDDFDDDYYDDYEDDMYDQVSDMGDDYDEEFEKSTKTGPSGTISLSSMPSEKAKPEPEIPMRPTKDGYEQPMDVPKLPTISDEQARAAGLPELEDTDIPEVPDFGELDKKSVNDASEQDWERAFREFKIDQAKAKDSAGFGVRGKGGLLEEGLESEAGDGLGALSVVTSMTRKTGMTNKQYRRSKGRLLDQVGRRAGLNSVNADALTEMTGLSMSSSAVYRNKHLTMLDDRFDNVEEEYLNDREEDDLNDDTLIKYGMPKSGKKKNGTYKQRDEFDMKKERADLENILDDFLDNHAYEGRKFYKK